jgi:hypothetical protein
MVGVRKRYDCRCLWTVKFVWYCCCRPAAAIATATYDVTGPMWGKHAKTGFEGREEARHRGLPDVWLASDLLIKIGEALAILPARCSEKAVAC